jgi:hypothetical protein
MFAPPATYDGMLVIQERHFAPQLSTNVPQQTVTYTRGCDLSGMLEGAAVILRVKTRRSFAGQNHPPRGTFSSYHVF